MKHFISILLLALFSFVELSAQEIVKENQLGFVSAPGDYEGLSKNIQAMSHLPDEEYRQLKANCLRLSQTTFCFERQLEAYKRFLSAF